MRVVAILMLLCAVARGQVAFDTTVRTINLAPIANGTNYTVTAWVKPEVSSMGSIAGFIVSDREYLVGRDDFNLTYNPFRTNFVFSVINSAGTFNTVTNSTPIISGNLYFLTGVCGNGKLQFYCNGKLTGERTLTIVPNDASRISTIGNYYLPDANGRYVGTITDVRVYNYPLSESEIAEIFDRPWSLSDNISAMPLKTAIVTNDTGSLLTGTMLNYGSGLDGTFSNSPTATSTILQLTKPRGTR